MSARVLPFAVISLIACTQRSAGEAGAADPTLTQPGEGEDLFAGELPEVLVVAHVRQLDGELLDIDLLRDLHTHGLEHGHDARPWLLLARDSMLRTWAGIAVRQYRIAIEADPRAADQALVLKHVVAIAAGFDGIEHRESSALLSSVWGESALSEIDCALEAALALHDERACARLEEVRGDIIPDDGSYTDDGPLPIGNAAGTRKCQTQPADGRGST